jgi:hypothetical protein
MRVLRIIALAACVSFCFCAGVCLAADNADLIEFATLKEAQQFGWEALPGAVMTTAKPGKIGDYALRIDPSPEPKEYMGIGVLHDFDLTGAKAEDKMIFFVKQNFGADLCVNLRTAKGNIYRYIKVTQGEWSRVELDLDLAKWEQTANPPVDAWAKLSYLHIYSRGFDKAGQYMLMDGFSIIVGGKPVVTLSKKEPEKK